jgi:hypothetical protein
MRKPRRPPFTNASIAVLTHSWLTNGLWSVVRFGSRCGKDGALWHCKVPVAEILCVGCLEKRIGRELAKADFTEVPIRIAMPCPSAARSARRSLSR